MTSEVRAPAIGSSTPGIIALQLGISLALVVAILPVLSWISGLGRGSAYEFMIRGGDVENGVRLGVGFAVAQGLMLLAVGHLCLIRIPRGRFFLPGWGGAIVVALVIGLMFVALFFVGLGGLGGAQPEPPEAQRFGRGLHDTYPAVSTLTVAGLIVAMLLLRQYRHRLVRLTSAILPALVAAVTTAVLISLTFTAHSLHV